jgi:molecular chaperone HscA
MLKDSFTTAEADVRARALAEARVDADRLILATRSALNADADLLAAAELADINAAMAALAATAQLDDAAAIDTAAKALAHATESFAAQRMNRGIAKALSGKNIGTL